MSDTNAIPILEIFGNLVLPLQGEVSDAQCDAATARVLELGGSWDGEERTLATFTWRTYADPEGTEFDIALEAG